MAILSQYNILGFYTDKTLRQWERSANKELHIVFLETNKVPSIQLIVSAATAATIQLIDVNDNNVGSALNMTIGTQTGYKQLIYKGTTLTGNSDGYYSLKITNGSEVYYSDVFAWISDSSSLSQLLKISITSANIKKGITGYSYNLTGFTYLCYLNADKVLFDTEFNGDANEIQSVPRILYGNSVKTEKFNIYGCPYIYNFLYGIPALRINGVVTITFEGITYTANYINLKVKEDFGGNDLADIELTFIDNDGVISPDNSI
ncbi:MAG: hypothetical protein WC933_03570 [Candidatus Paceibacterota bacterium]|jgi:hypothetical protein